MDYSELAGVYSALETTSSRLEKTAIVARLLKKTSTEVLGKVVLLLQRRVFPEWDSRELGFAAKLVLKALNLALGIAPEVVVERWKKTGDLGLAAEILAKSKVQSTLFSQKLRVSKVFENLKKISFASGDGSVDRKIQLLAELITSASPMETKYLVRTALGDLRVGVGEGVLRDGIVWAFFGKDLGIECENVSGSNALANVDRDAYKKIVDAVQHAYDMTADYAEVAVIASKGDAGELGQIQIAPLKPFKSMLFQKVLNVNEAFDTVGRPAAFEYKLDGFRMQIHRKGNAVKIFTRKLEDATRQFPEVADAVLKNTTSDSFIVDAEAVGLDKNSGKYLPFQKISQRIKRKYSIEELSTLFPVELNVFDIMYLDGESLLGTPFWRRRELLEKLVVEKQKVIRLAEHKMISGEVEAENFYKASLAAGNEGVMIKNLNGIYMPGSRVGYGVKLKQAMETLDVVIVGGTWGEGKRANWLSSFVVSVLDPETGNFPEIGNVGTGIKEKDKEGTSFSQLTEILRPLIVSESELDVKIKPEVVIEVEYEEIQESPSCNSGFALRFPRFVRLREDKSPFEASTIEDLKRLYEQQRGSKKI